MKVSTKYIIVYAIKWKYTKFYMTTNDFEIMHHLFLYFVKLFSAKMLMKQIVIEIITRKEDDKLNMQSNNRNNIELLEYYIVYKHFII